MKTTPVVLIVTLLMFVGLSCRLADRIAGSDDNLKRSTDLWSDVPKMDSFAASEMEMPFAIKVIMRTVLNNLWRLNEKNEDQTPASGDWIVFSSSSTPADVRGFYTNEKMTSFGGWEASKQSCLDPKDSGIDGTLCVFQKIANGKDTKLAIIAMKDESTKQTNVFFIRVEQDAKPAAATANTAPKTEKPPITPLSGAAPYGIERRPMPAGNDLDRLLPRQVGAFERVLVEQSAKRAVPTTSVAADGSSVYATYRNGDKEIFVEFGINTKPEDAQASLDVAASEVTDGFPTDPKFGSLGTEPSYLRVLNESGAFMAWTRGGYYFSANAKGGEADLDAFMSAFPY